MMGHSNLWLLTITSTMCRQNNMTKCFTFQLLKVYIKFFLSNNFQYSILKWQIIFFGNIKISFYRWNKNQKNLNYLNILFNTFYFCLSLILFVTLAFTIIDYFFVYPIILCWYQIKPLSNESAFFMAEMCGKQFKMPRKNQRVLNRQKISARLYFWFN